MKTSDPSAVKAFLAELENTEADKHAIVKSLREIVFDHFPKATEKIMYGGIVFFLEDEMITGIFVSKNHVSQEFGRGYLMEDPSKHLEGKGKYRRHLKFRDLEDIERKQTSFYVKQAVE